MERKFILLVSEARDLLKKDIFGLSDPYVKATYWCGSRHFNRKTNTIKKTLQPHWKEVLEFDLKDDLYFSVVLDVYDENILSRDDFLGRAILHLDLRSLSHEVTNEHHRTSDTVKRHGVEVTRTLKDKWHSSLLDGFHSFPHVRNMASQFEQKRYQRVREQHDSWGQLQVFYSIYERNDSGPLQTPPATVTSFMPSPSPSLATAPESDSDSDVETPPGWERRVDSNGRVLFVNHVHRRASLRRPPQRQRSQPQQQQQQPTSLSEGVGTGAEVTPANEDFVHHRRFLQRNHSIDVISDQTSGVEDEESVSGTAAPPNAQGDAVLRPLDSIELGFSVSRLDAAVPQGTTERGGSGSISAGASPSAGASVEPSHPTQLLTALERASQGLPPNWEASMTPAGRMYYINHDTQTTTWEKPRYQEVKPTAPPPAAEPVEQDPELPEGWEVRQNEDGRTYYVNHHTKVTAWDHPLNSSSSRKEQMEDLGPLPSGWEEKQMKDGRIFFVDHATHSTQWEDPRLLAKNKPTTRIQYSRDFKQKYTNFLSKLSPKHQIPRQFDIPCRRDHLFEDTYNVIMNVRDVEMLKARLYVVFEGESGLDYGGVSREWFHLLSHEMFNPYYGLFEYSASDDYTLQLNPESETYNEHHLDYFKLIGRICGMAVYHKRLIDGFFIRPFYKMMLRKPVTLDDMQSVDVELWNSFTYILENDPEPLCLDFSINKTIFDKVIEVDLKPGGRDIPVTEKNKKEYIDLLMKWRFSNRVKKQMDAFLEGFSDLVPLRLIKVFDERELEYLLGGLSSIDTEDWKKNTDYDGYESTDQVIQWFWKAVENYDEEMRARLLQFVTGTSKVPMNGFSELQGSQGPRKFCLKKYGTANSLPRAHTCFNRIDLPPYRSYHKLKEMLCLAVENTEGFEGVD